MTGIGVARHLPKLVENNLSERNFLVRDNDGIRVYHIGRSKFYLMKNKYGEVLVERLSSFMAK